MSGRSSTQRHESKKQTSSVLHCRSHDQWRLVPVPSEKDEIEDWKVRSIIGDDLYIVRKVSAVILSWRRNSHPSRPGCVQLVVWIRSHHHVTVHAQCRTPRSAVVVSRSSIPKYCPALARYVLCHIHDHSCMGEKGSCDRAAARSKFPAPPASCSGHWPVCDDTNSPRPQDCLSGSRATQEHEAGADDLPSGVSFPRRKL